MGYFIDLHSISLEEYAKKLEKVYLVPSRMILKENIKENFRKLKSIGINSLYDIQQTLKKKDKIKEIAEKSKLSKEFLVILLREINSINPKPNILKEIPGISSDIIIQFEKNGIKNTFQLYPFILTKKKREEFARKYNLKIEQVIELAKLSDLSRIKWASPIFTKILHELGYDTVEKVSIADYNKLHKEVNQANETMNYFKGNIGLNDIKIFVEAAKDVILEIEY